MSIAPHTQLRLRLLENGWSPIRNHDKRTFTESWPSLELTEETIRSWDRMSRDKATGIRIENGLVAIDVDADDEVFVADLANAVLDLVPALDDESVPWLVRHSGKAKEAWFFRVETPFGRLHTRRWLRPGENAEDHDTMFVEAFGGASPRQFGVFGPHTVERDGTVVREYGWVDRSPLDTRVDELPILTKEQVAAVVDTAERLMAERGWEPVKASQSGEDFSQRVYDLTEEMVFECDDFVDRTLAELREELTAMGGEGLRCSASWLEGPSAKRRDRCLVSLTRTGYVAVWESSSGVTHVEQAAEPRGFDIDIDRLAEKLEELKARRRNKITPADDLTVTVGKLLASYAYCPSQINCIVPIWAHSVEQGYTMQAFRTLLMTNVAEEVGPRGGRVLVNPVDVWVRNDQRVTVQGLRMRPDKPRPLYEDEHGTWVNTYSPPVHNAEGGNARAGIDFIEHLIPDAAERSWFLQWLAFKLRHPHIPGPAVVMVARNFGTGRGTLGELISRLMGKQYVQTLPFSAFTGKTYQSQYNEWLASSLFVVVNESSEATEGSTFKTKSNTYEHLKELVEPRMTERVIFVKGRQNYRALSSATFLIATNHEDALPIPASDRRFAIIRNGRPRDVDYWRELNDWMDREENIAAFHAWLRSVDLEGYSPFDKPPVFEGMRVMVEYGQSDLDRALADAIDLLESPVCVPDQLLNSMTSIIATNDYDVPGNWKSIAKKLIQKQLYRVGVPHGRNWNPMIEQRRYAVYATSDVAANRFTKADADELRREILRNGSPQQGPGAKLVKLAEHRNKGGE